MFIEHGHHSFLACGFCMAQKKEKKYSKRKYVLLSLWAMNFFVSSIFGCGLHFNSNLIDINNNNTFCFMSHVQLIVDSIFFVAICSPVNLWLCLRLSILDVSILRCWYIGSIEPKCQPLWLLFSFFSGFLFLNSRSCAWQNDHDHLLRIDRS